MLPVSHNYIFDGAWFCKCLLPVFIWLIWSTFIDMTTLATIYGSVVYNFLYRCVAKNYHPNKACTYILVLRSIVLAKNGLRTTISEHPNSKIFWGGMPPDLPGCCMLIHALVTWPLKIWWLRPWHKMVQVDYVAMYTHSLSHSPSLALVVSATLWYTIVLLPGLN